MRKHFDHHAVGLLQTTAKGHVAISARVIPWKSAPKGHSRVAVRVWENVVSQP